MSRNLAAALGWCAVSTLVLGAWGCGSALAGRTPGLEGVPVNGPKPTPERVALDLPERRVVIEPPLAAPLPETPPATDIFLVAVESEEIPWRLVGVERVTDREGYDNQPFFEEDGESLLFVSMRDAQTDIFRYRGGASDFEQVTATAESEYSPTPIPGSPGFSTVRVEADQTQRLWRFPRSPGEGRGGELVFEAIEPVGYHAWIDEETVAMFVLGEPNRLVLGDRATGEIRNVATDIGRALHGVPGKKAVSFVDKKDPERWWIVILDLATGARRRLVETPAGREDFIWWSSHEILIGDASKLYLFDLDLAHYWREVADLSEHGIDGITRLSRSPTVDRLAVVAQRAAS